MQNNNCDGSGPHLSGEVRVLPISTESSHGNLILCRACYDKEMSWRRDWNLHVAHPAEMPSWDTLAVYSAC